MGIASIAVFIIHIKVRIQINIQQTNQSPATVQAQQTIEATKAIVQAMQADTNLAMILTNVSASDAIKPIEVILQAMQPI